MSGPRIVAALGIGLVAGYQLKNLKNAKKEEKSNRELAVYKDEHESLKLREEACQKYGFSHDLLQSKYQLIHEDAQFKIMQYLRDKYSLQDIDAVYQRLMQHGDVVACVRLGAEVDEVFKWTSAQRTFYIKHLKYCFTMAETRSFLRADNDLNVQLLEKFLENNVDKQMAIDLANQFEGYGLSDLQYFDAWIKKFTPTQTLSFLNQFAANVLKRNIFNQLIEYGQADEAIQFMNLLTVHEMEDLAENRAGLKLLRDIFTKQKDKLNLVEDEKAWHTYAKDHPYQAKLAVVLSKEEDVLNLIQDEEKLNNAVVTCQEAELANTTIAKKLLALDIADRWYELNRIPRIKHLLQTLSNLLPEPELSLEKEDKGELSLSVRMR